MSPTQVHGLPRKTHRNRKNRKTPTPTPAILVFPKYISKSSRSKRRITGDHHMLPGCYVRESVSTDVSYNNPRASCVNRA